MLALAVVALAGVAVLTVRGEPRSAYSEAFGHASCDGNVGSSFPVTKRVPGRGLGV